MADFRYQRTDADLQRALLQLLTKYDFNQLSVAQLAKTSMVDRSTFYAHYDGLFELADGMIADAVTELFEKLTSYANQRQANRYELFSDEIVQYLIINESNLTSLRLISLGKGSFDARCRTAFAKLYQRVLGVEPDSFTSYLFVNLAMSDLDFVLAHHHAPKQQELSTSVRQLNQILTDLTD